VEAPATLVAPGALTLCCADMDAWPLFRTTADGGREGYEPEAAEAVCAALGVGLVWRFERWDRFREALEARRVDAIWCGSAITAERRKVFRYSRPYAAFDEGLLVRAESPIRSPADVAGRRVGAIRDSTNMALARTFAGAELVEFDGTSDDVFAEMVEAVRGGTIDGFVDDEPAFGGLEASGEFRVAFVAETQNPWGAALRLDDAPLQAFLDGGITRAVASGALGGVWARHFGRKPVPATLRDA
jgi:polar amino acid transport system substrate-binding protein